MKESKLNYGILSGDSSEVRSAREDMLTYYHTKKALLND